MKAKRKKRKNIKHANLVPKYNSRVRQEYIIDFQEYLHLLTEEEKDWLDKFSAEYYGASFKNDGTDLHQDDEQKRKIYGRNNARNRCLYGRIKNKVGPTKLLNYDLVKNLVEEELSKDIGDNFIEDALIDFIDSKDEK